MFWNGWFTNTEQKVLLNISSSWKSFVILHRLKNRVLSYSSSTQTDCQHDWLAVCLQSAGSQTVSGVSRFYSSLIFLLYSIQRYQCMDCHLWFYQMMYVRHHARPTVHQHASSLFCTRGSKPHSLSTVTTANLWATCELLHFVAMSFISKSQSVVTWMEGSF